MAGAGGAMRFRPAGAQGGDGGREWRCVNWRGGGCEVACMGAGVIGGGNRRVAR